MQEIKQPGEYSYTIGHDLQPIARIADQEEFWIYTEDAFNGKLCSEEQVPATTGNKHVNPLTGPLCVEGACPGDTLKIHILEIQPTRDFAVSALVTGFGGLTGTSDTRILNKPLPEKTWIYQIGQDGMVTHDANLSFPWAPFIGTIATANELESILSLTPFNHGGNMDCPEVKPGNILYLPVSVEGAHFFVGDCHAGQGEGELCGVALEISAKVRLKIEVVKGRQIQWPRIESPEELMVVGSAKPMEDAARIAYAELIGWMNEYGWDPIEAYQALSQAGKLSCANMVDTVYSMTAKVSKKLAHRKTE